MLQLRGTIDGDERCFPLHRPETTLGRAEDNDIVLMDRVTSRYHAVISHADDQWWIRDEASRYGLRVNGDVADETVLDAGDIITIDTVDFLVETIDEGPDPTVDDDLAGADVEPTPVANFMVSIDAIADSLGFAVPEGAAPAEPVEPSAAISADDEDERTHSGLAVGCLARLAQDLRTVGSIDEAGRRTLAVAFEALPIDRGWVLFTNSTGEVIDRLARIGDHVQHPEGELPISNTIVRRVLADRVSLATGGGSTAPTPPS